MAANKKTNKKTMAEPVSEGGLSYSGKATISLMRGKKTYRKFSTHNAGCMPLFKFIGRCLATDYDVRLTPYGIRLFHCDTESMASESSIFTDSLKEKTTTLIPKLSVSLSVDNKGKSVTASITFLIPFTAITKDEEGSNVIAMYDLEHAEDKLSPSAFIRLAAKNNHDSWVEDTDKVICGDGKTNVKVVWDMTINNASN